MVEAEILENIKQFAKLLRRRRIKVNKVILYGSRSTGRSHEYSDIDIAIISSDFGKDRFAEGVKLWSLARQVDPRIEPVPISFKSYEEDTWIPLIYEIKTKGIEINWQ